MQNLEDSVEKEQDVFVNMELEHLVKNLFKTVLPNDPVPPVIFKVLSLNI